MTLLWPGEQLLYRELRMEALHQAVEGTWKMSLDNIISPDAIIPLMRATNEKSVSLALSKRASEISGLDLSAIANAIFGWSVGA